jgi:hypothetical protein
MAANRRDPEGWPLTLACILLQVMGGCIFGDPSLVYRVPDWKVLDDDGRWYERDIDEFVRIRVYNSGFGGSFGVQLRIVNLGSEDLVFDGSPMYLVDRKGRPLSADLARGRGCDPRRSVRLPPGERLDVRCGFSADLFWMPSDILAIQPGLVLGRRAITLRIPMTTRG